jgi:MerR family mercuric resistance operon transcriptional regulator
MKIDHFSVGELAKSTNCKVETVHYYEKIGLIPEPPRSDGGHRQYSLSDVKRLNFIRRSRELGFKIDQVKELLKFIDEPDHYCGEVKAMAMVQIRNVQQKIQDLKRLQKALEKMVAQCNRETYTIENCPIIDSLYVESRDN